MKKTIKKLLIFIGVIFIAAPFVSRGTEYLFAPLLTKSISDTNNTVSQLTNKLNTPYPPSTYVTRAQKLLTQARDSRDPKQTSQKVRKALETINEGLIFYKDSSDLYATRAEIFEALDGELDDALLFALSDYKKAHGLLPKELPYATKASSIAAQLGFFEQAIEVLNKANTVYPNNPEILLELAENYKKAGQLEQSISVYTKLLSNIPSGEENKTIKSERDILAALMAERLQDINNVPAAAQNSQVLSIGGFSPPTPPPAENIPENITIKDKTYNPYHIDISNQSFSGEDILTAGKTNATVKNTNVHDASKVYIAPTSGNDNQVLYVSSKREGVFTVSVDEPLKKDVSFKWWVTK